MNKIKKIGTLFLALALTFSLAACSNTKELDHEKLASNINDVNKIQPVIGMIMPETIENYNFDNYVDKNLITEYYGVGGVSISVTPFMAFKPVVGKEDEVKEGVEEWAKNQIDMFTNYQPHNVPLIENKLIYETEGYIFYFISTGNEELKAIIDQNIVDGVFNMETFSEEAVLVTVEGDDPVFTSIEQVTDETYPELIEEILPADLIEDSFIIFSEWSTTSVFVLKGKDSEAITEKMTAYYDSKEADPDGLLTAEVEGYQIWIYSSNNDAVLDAIENSFI